MSLDLTILPSAVEDIVHQYVLQMNMKPVIEELKQVLPKINQTCGVCRGEFLSLHIQKCHNHNEGCHHTICKKCVNDEMRHEYHHYLDNPEDLFNMNPTELADFHTYVADHMECSDCTYMIITEDECDEEETEWQFEQLAQEMSGVYSYSF